MTYANMEIVKIKHKDTGAEGTSTVSAYEKVWRKQGFVLVDPKEPSKLRKAEDDVVFEGGLPPVDDGSDTKTAGNQAADTKKEGAK